MKKFKIPYFNTEPIIFHHNGRNSHNREGIEAKRIFFEQFRHPSNNLFPGRKDKLEYPIPPATTVQNSLNKDLTVFLVNNNEEPGSAIRCLDYYGYNYKVIGQNIQSYNHFVKYKVIYEFLKEKPITTKYTLFLDADDVFITKSLNELVENFEDYYNCQMLFNSEVFFYPFGYPYDKITLQWEKSLNTGNNPYQFLNSGVWIARTDFLYTIFDESFQEPETILDLGINNDQAFYKEIYRKYYPEIKIDRDNKWIFSTAWNKELNSSYKDINKIEIED